MNVLPTSKKSEWSSDDAAALRNFLTSDVGVRALEFVAENCPPLLDGSHMNKTLVRSGEVKGFSAAVTSLFDLTVKQPEKVESSTAYPPLDDESAWAKKENPSK